MNSKILTNKWIIVFQLVLSAFVFIIMPADALAQKKKDPKCRFRNLETNKIFKYRCDRFQSKGDRDSITPQIKIVEPADGATVLASDLADLLDENDEVVGKALPIKVVVSPEFVVDFTLAASPVDEYLFLPQEDGIGHAHAYISQTIEVDGDIDSVVFVGNMNRADLSGGFCVFREADESNEKFQVFSLNCPLQAFATMEDGTYNVSVDFTEHSHGPRMKYHPRDVPPFDKITIEYMNDLE